MLSVPPARTTSLTPVMICMAPFCTAVMPEAHWRMTVWAEADSGMPTFRAAMRAMLGSSEVWRHWPMMTSSISFGSMPLRSSTPCMTQQARS